MPLFSKRYEILANEHVGFFALLSSGYEPLLGYMQLLCPLLYGPHIDALLQDNEEELDCYLWFDKPWRMPAVKA